MKIRFSPVDVLVNKTLLSHRQIAHDALELQNKSQL